MKMSVKLFTGATTTMLSPQSNAQDHAASSPPSGDLWGSQFLPEATPSSLLTPPVPSSNSESILIPPSSPKLRGPSSGNSSSSHRVLLEEMLSAQMDLENIPEDDFFLVGPKQVFSIQAPVAPLLVRPRARRAGEVHDEPKSAALPSPVFQAIDEGAEDDLVQEAQKTRLKLKPRPSSLHDGQRAWESMSMFTAVFENLAIEPLE